MFIHVFAMILPGVVEKKRRKTEWTGKAEKIFFEVYSIVGFFSSLYFWHSSCFSSHRDDIVRVERHLSSTVLLVHTMMNLGKQG